jgi:uncharacterized protein (TIGR00730 family)
LILEWRYVLYNGLGLKPEWVVKNSKKKEEKMERAPKAYRNESFLNSSEARTLRILAEYLEPKKRFDQANIKHTVVFFGSARIRPGIKNNSPYDTSKYYDVAEEFSFQLASWAKELEKEGNTFLICSGGGPGIMEASNKGAQRAGADSIGLNISLPNEQNPNAYISPDLNFEFHYFFMRKLWFLYHAKALVVFPGGFGTLDEFFESITMVQTKKLKKFDMIILLYDQHFWEKLINFQQLVDYGLIAAEDLGLFHYFNSPEEGMSILKPRMEAVLKDFNS